MDSTGECLQLGTGTDGYLFSVGIVFVDIPTASIASIGSANVRLRLSFFEVNVSTNLFSVAAGLGTPQRSFFRILASPEDLQQVAAADDYPVVVSLVDDHDRPIAMGRVSLTPLLLSMPASNGASIDMAYPLISTSRPGSIDPLASVGISVSLFSEKRLSRLISPAPSAAVPIPGAVPASKPAAAAPAAPFAAAPAAPSTPAVPVVPASATVAPVPSVAVPAPVASVPAAAAAPPAAAVPTPAAASRAHANPYDDEDDEDDNWKNLATHIPEPPDRFAVRFEQSPEYQAAMEIAIWKEEQREKFRQYLKEREEQVLAALTEESERRQAERTRILDQRERELRALYARLVPLSIQYPQEWRSDFETAINMEKT